jgi:hypothetical protein
MKDYVHLLNPLTIAVRLAQDIIAAFKNAVLAVSVRVVDQGWECGGCTSLRPMQRHEQTSQSQPLALYKNHIVSLRGRSS